MGRLRPALGLLLLLVLEGAVVAALHLLGRVPVLALPDGPVEVWLSVAAPEDVVVATLRLVALACAWWLLGSTALYVLARVSRLPRAVAAVEWATLPAVRRLADRAVAVVLAASAATGSGAAALAADGPLLPPPLQGITEVADAPALADGISAAGPPASGELPVSVEASGPALAGGAAALAHGSPGGPRQDLPTTGGAADPTSDADGAAATPAAVERRSSGDGRVPAAAPPSRPAAEASAGAADGVGASRGEPRGAEPSGAEAGRGGPRGAEPPEANAGRADPLGADPGAEAGGAAARGVGGSGSVAAHVVVSGEHLWAIARDVLAAARGVPADSLTDREVHRYWVAVIAENDGVLRSGDPNLIFPGEGLRLPPPS